MGHLEDSKILQDKANPDWEKALDRFQHVLSSGTNKLEALIKFAHLSKHAPIPILAQSIPILSQFLTECMNKVSNFSVSKVEIAAVYCFKLIACRNDGALATDVGKSGALDCILQLLSSERCAFVDFRNVLIKCLWCLVSFSDENRVIVARNGGLERVVEMLGLVEDGFRVYLLEILSALALLREVGRVLLRTGTVRFLVEAGRHGSMASRERACQAMGLIGVNKRARPMLVEFGAIEVLVEMFRDGDSKARLVAGNALGVISAHVSSLRSVAQSGAIVLYADLLTGSDPIGKEIAEDVFCILAVAEENAVAIADHLVRILSEGDDDAKVAAADVVWDLSSYTHSIPVMTSAGAIPILVDLLRDGSREVKEKVSGAIAQLSYNDADRAALAAAGALPILIELQLEDQSDELKDNAAEALVNFSKNPHLREIINQLMHLHYEA